MNIITDRLVLRAIEEYDNSILKIIINDPETEYLLGGWSFPVSDKMQNDWFSNLSKSSNDLRCIIAEKENIKNAIGSIMLTNIDYKNGTAEIHIKLLPGSNRGKGYGTEAVRAICQYAFYELRLNCIFALINSINYSSQKLFEKCDFTKEGVLRNRIYKNGKYTDVISYSLLSQEISTWHQK